MASTTRGRLSDLPERGPNSWLHSLSMTSLEGSEFEPVDGAVGYAKYPVGVQV